MLKILHPACVLITNFQCVLKFYCRSMYFDEDGELAHEFYEEVRKKGGGRKMRRVNEISKNGQRNLVPQVNIQTFTLQCRKQNDYIKKRI